MADLRYIEKKAVKNLFNQQGYVLDFSTRTFDEFTYSSIGIALCEHYKLSKGGSLDAFIEEGDDQTVAKLLTDLLEYYLEVYLITNKPVAEASNIELCKGAIQRLSQGSTLSTIRSGSEKLINVFNSDYIAAQIKQMNDAIESNPTDAIGKAKELLESCCKTILTAKKISINKDWTVQQLMKNTCKELKLTPDNIPDTVRAGDIIKQILGSLTAISTGMSELRNSYGTGHGKDTNYKGLSPRHARLAVGASVTVVLFIWETFEEKCL